MSSYSSKMVPQRKIIEEEIIEEEPQEIFSLEQEEDNYF